MKSCVISDNSRNSRICTNIPLHYKLLDLSDSGFDTGEAGFLDTGLEFQVILEIPEFPEILVSRYYMWCGFWQAGPI